MYINLLQAQLDQYERDLAAANAKIDNLNVALRTARTIGAAVGIIIERTKLSYDDAFAMLINVSQHDHRKISDLAEELLLTGVIPQPRSCASA